MSVTFPKQLLKFGGPLILKHGSRTPTLCQKDFRSLKRRYLSKKSSNSKITDKPITTLVPPELLPEVPEIDIALVQQLERMSLVEFADEGGLQELRNAVKSANQLLLVNTEGVEPLDSVLEDRPLYLRDDVVTEGDCVQDILSNATKVEEQYFVAPPGNIPLKKKQRENVTKTLDQEPGDES